MSPGVRQQIVISGVGGQGVLFVTRLLAEAAIGRGLSVLTSETHGMAQRGGTVVSHLKLGDFAGPLVRAGAADVLLALHADGPGQFGHLLRPGGAAWVNGTAPDGGRSEGFRWVDADRISGELGSPRSANLVLLGFAAGPGPSPREGGLFCGLASLIGVLEKRFAGKPDLGAAAAAALRAGAAAAPTTTATNGGRP